MKLMASLAPARAAIEAGVVAEADQQKGICIAVITWYIHLHFVQTNKLQFNCLELCIWIGIIGIVRGLFDAWKPRFKSYFFPFEYLSLFSKSVDSYFRI
jgi:hypothetical protein